MSGKFFTLAALTVALAGSTLIGSVSACPAGAGHDDEAFGPPRPQQGPASAARPKAGRTASAKANQRRGKARPQGKTPVKTAARRSGHAG